ncbi:Siderophore biosynthesis non-ribosomal peptide synthetase modules [Alloactinosynnema sp. L-07]|uniref:non-ribosomal peptide synthetase n=1 Tax=Alloactinosynnema sp. L-07 TaxID=1653480 RepID=UPI00065EFEE1|nr:non-ribosomal peptide synthetase [Alloactinosynnema sp. L-07]CRK62219.1 Siderophore biosynthesis non-ribosomal peptide synthetase modules [Alloactinosynnema sp. L-07]
MSERDRLFALLAAKRGLAGADTIPRRPADAVVPLLPGQRQLWFLDQVGATDGVYTMSQVWRLTGAVDISALRAALAVLLDRHEGLRTSFAEVDGEPVQRVAAAVPPPLSIVDGGDDGIEVLRAEFARPFDLTNPPLLRAVLVRCAGEDLFALCVHHIVCDGPSLSTLVGELSALLAGQVVEGTAVSACDYAVWQADRDLAGHGRYWSSYLADVPTLLELPTDRPRPPTQSFRGASHPITVDGVAEFCAREGLTAFPVLLTAFALVLSRLSRSDDLAIGVPMRDDTRLSGCVGMLANTVALRYRLAGDPTIRAVLDQAKTDTVNALEHQSHPWELVARELVPHPDLSHNPVFQTMFVLNPAASDVASTDLGVTPLPTATTAARFDLTLAFAPEGDRHVGQIDYATDLFDASTIARFANYLQRAVAAVVSTPDARVSEIDLLTSAEWSLIATGGHVVRGVGNSRHQAGLASRGNLSDLEGDRLVLGERVAECLAALELDHTDSDAVVPSPVTYPQAPPNQDPLTPATDRLAKGRPPWEGWGLREGGFGGSTGAPVPALVAEPGALVPALVAEQAVRTPDAPAVIDGGRVLTYGELVRRANAVAWRLRERGVGPESLVALVLPAGPEAIIGIVGIHAAGAAYLPLDPTHPADRIQALLDDAKPHAVIGAGDITGDTADAPPPVELHADNLAYVIYTSGSTGAPKGVAVTHGTLANLAQAFAREHGFGPGEHVLMIPPLTFDASVGDVFPALISGAAIQPSRDPASLSGADILNAQGITMVDTAVPLWQKWVDDLAATGLPDNPAPVRAMMVGGDSVAVETIRAWSAMTGSTVFNHYGPTEATVCATTYRTTDAREIDSPRLPIGRPLPHVRAYVLDDGLRPVPHGVPGELCLGGDTLARGYLGRGDLTAERFVPDPFGEPGSRLYRTGDLARWRSDDTLEFLGRVDRQVKVRGHRIEPGEVEAACRTHPGVTDALVVARGDKLVAYLIADAVPTDLKAFLRAKLPDYMVPNETAVLDEFPLLSNGKLDHKALPAPESATKRHVEPATANGRVLAAEWARLLDRDRVSADDNFFDLGGHSLLAARMVTRVKVALGVELALQAVFETATLDELAALIDKPQDSTLDLWAEAVLPPDIKGQPAKHRDPRAILLTGATGFLGGYLLADALQHTDARIFCLVRAKDEADALDRIERTLRGYELWRPEFAHRIVPVPGDLAEPRLGLTEERFDALAAEVDLIHHCGGLVNFAKSYADLKPANVDGTLEVLRLATRHRTVPVHFVSTLGIYPLHLPGVVTEDLAPNQPEALDRGYEQSKWVADTLVRAARAAGVPVSVHRPARVTGDSRTGIGPAEDLFGRELRTVTELGALPEVDDEEDMAPVDHVAAAIGWLSRQPSALGRDFHFHNGQTIHTSVIAKTLREFGYDVEALPYARWYELLLRRAAESDDPAFTAIAAVSGPTPDRRDRVFDCSATEAALAAAGIVCPPADPALLSRYLTHYVRAGHLAPVDQGEPS